MEQALGRQGITEQEKVLDPKNRVHADSVLRQYEDTIKKIVYSVFKGATDVPMEEREEVFYDVCRAFWKMLYYGEFRGKHKRASVIVCISTIARNKRNNFLKGFIREKRFRAYAPFGLPTKKDETEPCLEDFDESHSYFSPILNGDPIRKYEKKERDRFIVKETKYPEIIDMCKKGYSRIEIANTMELKEEQVKKRIQREIKRLTEKAQVQGWYYK